MARVELIIRKSGVADAYDADLLVFDESGNPSQVADSLEPIPPELTKAIDNWQQSFSQLVGTRRGTIKAGKTFYGNCADSAGEVRAQFSTWLKAQDSWARLQNYTQQSIASKEELQVNIQTLDPRLRLLPWNEAFADKHQRAETSISLAREYQKGGTLRVKPQVRILAVLGNPGETKANSELGAIDVSFDQQQLEQTKARGAYIETLEQPTAEELKTALGDSEGWHIFFFAGHSMSQSDSSIGSVVLNDKEDPLSIDTLKSELAIAIENGLQLAIFNSCDGLGLASQLAALNLPQSIVMREPVPDDVAKDFLQQFLKAFSNNQSLFESVRRAREFLKNKWDSQSQYPGASWLPTIVRNPAVSLPFWKDFVAESPLSRTQFALLSVATFVLLCSLYLSLFLEFGKTTSFVRPSYLYYAQLYPHIILYPWLVLWAAYYTLYKAWCQIRTRPKLKRQIAGCVALTLIVLCVELTQDNLLLFELQNGAESVISVTPQEMEIVLDVPKSILETEPLVDTQAGTLLIRKADMEAALNNFSELKANKLLIGKNEEYHKFMELGLAYATWKGRSMFSMSRTFYAIEFAAIVAAVMAAALFWWEIGTRYVFNPTMYSRCIIASQTLLLAWFPFRIYHNVETKQAIFGTSAHLSGLDIIAYPVVLLLLSSSIHRSWKFEYSYFAGLFSLLAVVGLILIGSFFPGIVNNLFGVQSSPGAWIFCPLLLLIAIYMVYPTIFSRKADG